MSEDAQTAAPPRLAIKHQNGTEGGPPVLLLHGAWHASWVWENWLSLFAARGWDACVLDLRGHGASEGSYREARLTDYLADVRGAIDTFERTPVLVGHSLGGLLIQHLVAEQPFPRLRCWRRFLDATRSGRWCGSAGAIRWSCSRQTCAAT